MGIYERIKALFIKQYKENSPEYKVKVRAWRKQNSIMEIDKPTNLARARQLGYRAKEGYFLVRVKIGKGRRARPSPSGGRKPRHNYKFKSPGLSLQTIAEHRANKKYPVLEVLNSYWVGEDGQNKFFEIILVEPAMANLKLQTGRSSRGLTSTGKKARGLRHKGKKAKAPPR